MPSSQPTLTDSTSLLEIVEHLFYLIDLNNDGTLTKRECLKAFQRTDTSAYEWIYNLSSSHPTAAPLKLLLKPTTYKATFQNMDTDADNRVSVTELLQFCIMSTTGTGTTAATTTNKEEEEKEDSTMNDQTAAIEDLTGLETMCATIHHLDSPTLLGIRQQVVTVGRKHEQYLNSVMDDRVDLTKINQFSSQTRGELLSCLIQPPTKVKQVCMPMCTLYNLPQKWCNVRPSVKKMRNGTTAIFQTFQTMLIKHDEERLKQERQQRESRKQVHTEEGGDAAASVSYPEFPPIVYDLKNIVENPNLMPR